MIWAHALLLIVVTIRKQNHPGTLCERVQRSTKDSLFWDAEYTNVGMCSKKQDKILHAYK